MNAIILNEPPFERWNEVQNKLEISCNKQDLLRYAETFIPWFSQCQEVIKVNAEGRRSKATETVNMMKSNAPKSTIANGVALILADDHNLMAYIDTLSQEMYELWRTVLTQVFVTHQAAKDILKTSNNLFSQEHSYYHPGPTWNKREYGWFSTSRQRGAEKSVFGYREYEYYITINSYIHSIFFPLFFPEAYDDLTLQQLPEGHWRTLSFEADSLSHYNLFSGLMKQDAFPLKKKGISTTDMKRAQKKMALEEFFPGDNNPYHENLRAFSYIRLLALHEHTSSRNKKVWSAITGKYNDKNETALTYEDTLRDLVNTLNSLAPFLPEILYPHIKGLRKQITEYGREIRLIQTMIDWLREKPDDWSSLSDIFLKIFTIVGDTTTAQKTALVYNPANEDFNTEIVNDYTHQTIAANDYSVEFGYTGLQVFAFLLSSVGILEIAINEDTNRHISPFDSLEYVRLTPLGRYALYLTNEYVTPDIEQVAYFELDPDRLIIRSLIEPNPYAQLLLDTSKPISKNRFETSALSFLSNCHTRQDVESKISTFRQFIADELPPLWEQFFQSLLQHCHPLMEDKTNYKRYTLSPDNRDLITLITTDPVLRDIIIRAEGYRIMVKTEDLHKFENQLKKHGYLL